MSDSVRSHRWQPTRLPRPWDSPGKNTGVACHFLLQCRKVKSESEVTQSCPTLSDPMNYSLPGSSIHGIFPGKSTGVGCHCLLCIIQLPDTKSLVDTEMPPIIEVQGCWTNLSWLEGDYSNWVMVKDVRLHLTLEKPMERFNAGWICPLMSWMLGLSSVV